ncbi:MAG: CBS domain-containing protein [Rhodospirillales bacterium]|nr:CBS domain-containing protein [Rhodospirillales bacterium]
MQIKDIIKRKGGHVDTAPLDMTLSEAAQMLCEHQVALLVICNKRGDIVGVLSERDVLRGLAEEQGYAPATPIKDYVTPKFYACTLDADIADVLKIMNDGGFRHVPVIELKRLFGIVSILDLLRFLVENQSIKGREEMWQKLNWM